MSLGETLRNQPREQRPLPSATGLRHAINRFLNHSHVLTVAFAFDESARGRDGPLRVIFLSRTRTQSWLEELKAFLERRKITASQSSLVQSKSSRIWVHTATALLLFFSSGGAPAATIDRSGDEIFARL